MHSFSLFSISGLARLGGSLLLLAVLWLAICWAISLP